MKRMNLFCIGLLATLVPSLLPARIPVIKVAGEKQTQASAVTLQRMDIDVEMFGNVAVTTMTVAFHNHSARILEGELIFPMPEGVTVSRYAIDISGKMREAVPVSKVKATEVFESIEHRQIDPGLLERIEGNHFRTRIYPLPAGGERTVRISYEETLPLAGDRSMQYHLPLDCPQAIPAFSLRMKVYQSVQRPQWIEQPDSSLAFTEDNRIYAASMQKSHFRPSRALTVRLPKSADLPESIMQKNRDGSYCFLLNTILPDSDRPKTWSNRIGIIWDNSLSGLQRDRTKEWELLDKIIRQKQNLTVEVGLLNIRFVKAKTFTVRNGNWAELKSFLQNVVYDGGTDFSQLQAAGFSAEEYLFFSDGLSTFGPHAVSIRWPVHCISSSSKADFSSLKALCNQTGGKFVNLAGASAEDAFRLLNRHRLRFLGIEEKELVSEVYPSMPVETDGHLSVAGIIRGDSKELTLLFGYDRKAELRRKVKLEYKMNDVNVSRVWAQKKIAEMDVHYGQNKEDNERLGRQFGIVTRHTSLLVLESAADYARYEIEPPVELRSEYDRLVKERRVQKEVRVNNLLERAVGCVNELKTWWETDFKAEKPYPVPEEESEFEEVVIAYSQVTEDRVISEQETVHEAYENDAVIASENPAPSRAERMAARRQRVATERGPAPAFPGQTGAAPPSAVIRLPNIRNDHAWMPQIAAAADPYATYLSLRETYVETPAFFLDVASFFFGKRQHETGLLVLSCLADLDLENADLFKTLAYKLKEHGEYARELFVTQKIREWRPMDPQSHRDYALALQDNGRYREALDCLYGILNASYSPEAANRDNGIEEILVCEINNLISRHRSKLKTDNMDPRLIAGLPVNIRVVINWNRNDTDIDLWVIDPNGEKCFYGHKQTSIGGRLSNDFTRGYGPEQFLLKKAINGTYQVKTHFFGERQLTLSGPTTIMGEIYLYYSDGQQERKVITFQNDKKATEKNEEVLIGEFVFTGEDKQAEL
jgi:tetratricopeptide (TPR) repeat protein